jgi:DNA polymerase III epsilon subunit-like protein
MSRNEKKKAMSNLHNNQNQNQNQKQNYIMYDLETNGLPVLNVSIMQISILDGETGAILLDEYVWPYDGVIAATQFHGIDKKRLRDNNALTLPNLMEKIKRVLREKYSRQDVVWVAYNNFGFDQLVLEANFKRVNGRMPDNWLFMDLLPMVRSKFSLCDGMANYKLGTVFHKLCKQPEGAPPIAFHTSLADTQCLYELFKLMEYLFGDEFLEHTRPKFDSSRIFAEPLETALLGYHPHMRFGDRGMHTIKDMYAAFLTQECCVKEFKKYLTQELGVRRTDRAAKMSKQMHLIHSLFHMPCGLSN